MVSSFHKSLAISFLVVSIFILGVSVDFVGAQGAAADREVSRPSSDPLLSKYLRFVRLTAEDVLSGDHTRNVVQDQRGLMWIGTLSGLNRFDGTGVKLYRNDPDNPNSLSNNVARALIVDQNGVLWIGTWGGGLNRFDPDQNSFSYVNEKDGLADDEIYGILQDEAGKEIPPQLMESFYEEAEEHLEDLGRSLDVLDNLVKCR